MSKTIKGALTPKKISAPNKHTELSTDDKKRFNKCIYKGGWFPKKYREWTNLTNLINGKTAQCGHGTLYIGSPTGDRPQPAPIHISGLKHPLTKNDKVHKITVSFKCRLLNVKDGGGAWTNNIAESDKAIIQGYRIWFGGEYEKNKLSSVKTSSKPIKYNGKTKNGYNWINISETFTDISIDDIFDKNFALNIAFGYNCSKASTECDLFIKGLDISLEYENSKIYIEGKNNNNTLYTSNQPNCSTTITQTIESGYISNGVKISPSKAPEKLGDKIIVASKPTGVQVNKNTSNDNTTVFTITDKSGKTGKKYITYKLSNHPTKTVKVYYTAKTRPLPTYSVETNYKANEDYNPNKVYIAFKNGCTPYIDVYIDKMDSSPLRLNVSNQNSTSNLLNQNTIKLFHDKVKSLKCGTHTLYFKRGNESVSEALKNHVEITVSPMEYKFEVYSENNADLVFNQVKNNTNRKENITIKRIDDEPKAIIPTLDIIDETDITGEPHSVTNIKKGDIITHQIDKYYAGTFFIKIIETNVLCTSPNNIFATITINSSHKQNYDYLFTRGEDGTAFDFDYLVAWEGDNIRTPINVDTITYCNSDDDIRICASPAQAGLSQIGQLELRVSNRTQNKVLENIKIELNTLVKNDDDEKEITTEEWTSLNGLFSQFYNLFNDYNKEIIKNVTVENLTPDGDLIDEENVYLHIRSLEAGGTIKIILPFRSTVEKEVFLQFLLFENPQKIYDLSECENAPNNPDQPTDVMLTVVDSMLTELDISGNTDLLSLNDTYPCPTECYTTTEDSDLYNGGITYTITNIDTGDFTDLTAQTIIENSNEIQPYAYKLKGNNEIHELYDENGNLKPQDLNSPIQWKQETITNPIILSKQLLFCHIEFKNHEETILVARTSNNGFAEFFIEIPHTVEGNYTINDLLSEVIYIEYKGDKKYNPFIYSKKEDYPLVESDSNKYEVAITPNDNYRNDNYRRYKAGQIAHLTATLTAKVPVYKNKITFNPQLKNIGSSDSVTVFYKICNIDNGKGIFKTTFSTNSKFLIPNKISKDIYCGIDTELKMDTKLEKEIIESEKINVLHIDVHNQIKLNKDVLIKIDIGKHNRYIGTYEFLDINIDDGDYSVEENNGNAFILWQIGEMNPYQTNKGIIKIKAKNIGISDIEINAYDYLHNPNEDNPIENGHHCPKCPENSSYKLKDSMWENHNGVWYKKIDGVYKRKKLINGILQWVVKGTEEDTND